MEAIYPITSLQKNNAEVKAEARERLVHITENGRAAYVFMSEQVLDELIAREREQAVWDAELMASVERSLDDFANGRFYHADTVGEFAAKMRELRGMKAPKSAERANASLFEAQEAEVAYA